MTIHTMMTPLERMRQRPFEHVIAVSFVLVGGTRLAGRGPLVEQLTGPTAIAWSITLLIAAAFIVVGLHWRGDPVVRAVVESVGWYLGIAATVGGPFLLWIAGYGWNSHWSDDLLLAGAAGLRIWFLRAESGAIKRLRALELAQAQQEE